MAEISMAVLERSRAVSDRVDDFPRCESCANWLVSATQTFGDRLNVRYDPLLLPRMQGAGSTPSAHYFVEDEKRAVTVADLADRVEIPFRRRNTAGSRADNRFGDEGGDRIGA